MLSAIIKKEIEIRYKRKVRYPKDCEGLAAEITCVCNERVSASTLKRLYGFAKGANEPRLSTLDIIANYLGCNNWDDLLKKHCNIELSEYNTIEELQVSKLKTGDKIEFKYEPNRVVIANYKGKNTFEVISSKNSKLRQGDYFKTHHFVLNHPLIVYDVLRGTNELGQYKAGNVSGITSIRKL
ncbi:MAG: hypothetical protein WBM13_11320 [Bacteroidia bacterium]